MNLQHQLFNTLDSLGGVSCETPKSVEFSVGDSIKLVIELVAVDTMSCAVREIRLRVPRFGEEDFDTLTNWAHSVCRRVTYLLETLEPIEFDRDAGRILVRSQPPAEHSGQTQFYEALFDRCSGDTLRLSRLGTEPRETARRPVDMQMTREVLGKLIDDLVESIPAGVRADVPA